MHCAVPSTAMLLCNHRSPLRGVAKRHAQHAAPRDHPSLPPDILHTPHILVPPLLHLLLLDWAGRDLCGLAGRPLLRLVLLLLRLAKGCAVPQLLDGLALLAALHHNDRLLQYLLVDLLNRL